MFRNTVIILNTGVLKKFVYNYRKPTKGNKYRTVFMDLIG